MILRVDNEFFSIKDTLECGQVFRFRPIDGGRFLLVSKDKACICYDQGGFAVIECEKNDLGYFSHYFDLGRDYKNIYRLAVNENIPILTEAASVGKGIRILNQDKEEMLFSFIVSQNNNIPRIKKILERIAEALGDKKSFNGYDYYTFPSAERLALKDKEFYALLGLGYRAPYIVENAKNIVNGFDLEGLGKLNTIELKKALIALYGVGPKVADCVSLFGFHRADSFPVDTWIEKVYHENFNGTEKSNNKITEFFLNKFKDNSGYVQQYLFSYKRNVEG